MLRLVLASALTVGGWSSRQPQPDPQIAEILQVCDTPAMMKACSSYLRGFVDALQAREDIATLAKSIKAPVPMPSVVCFDGGYDLEGIRKTVVAVLKDSPRGPARVNVLAAIAGMYPCNGK